MSKTGVTSQPKDGGALTKTHPTTTNTFIRKEKDEDGRLCETQAYADAPPQTNCVLHFHNGLREVFHSSDEREVLSPTSCVVRAEQTIINEGESPEVATEEDEPDLVKHENLDWLKSNIHSGSVDILEMPEMEVSKDSALPLSIANIGIDTHSLSSDLSENLTDFVFSASLPDNIMIKQSVGSNYLEVLESGDYSTSNFTSPNVTWSSNQTPQTAIASQPHVAVSGHSGAYVSFPDNLDDSVISANSTVCSSTDFHNILFEQISQEIIKPDSSSGGQVPFSETSAFAVDRNSLCSQESVISNVAISNPALQSVPLTFSGTIADQIPLSGYQDPAGDLNLNSLPNFLGLDHNVSNSSISSGLIDSQSVNILESMGPSVTLTDQSQSGIKIENAQAAQDNAQLANNNLSVTTISISNDEEHATKILVDTHQGQQQMYVINTADLNRTQCTKISVNQGQHMYVINTSDLQQGSNDSFNISTVDSNVENFSGLQSNPTLPSHSQSGFAAQSLPGFVLMPVVDSSSNVIQAVPLQIEDGNSDIKRPPKKMLMCNEPGCSKTFKKASKLKVHQMLHTGERPFKCSLLGCEWAFTTSHKLKRHMEAHEGRKDYICDKPGCGHRFTTIYNLNTHRKLHDRPCTEPCPEDGCNQSFPTKRQLDIHLRNVHACEDRTFKCPEPGCEKVFFSSGCMGSHMRVHQQSKEDLRCKFQGCGKEFTKMCRLKQHERLHSGEKPFICDYQGCTWAFATASKLKRHQTKHTGVRNWVCHVCHKPFHRSEHLKGHLITHSGDRPFVCPVEGCGNTFTAKSSLYVHLKKHDESGKTIVYHCPMEKCERHYTNKASLRQHILVKHCSLPQKGAIAGQGVASWLSLLGSGDSNSDMGLPQESYVETEGLTQAALTPSQDSMLATDFLTGGMADQALLNSSTESIPDQTCANLISHLMVSTGVSITSPAGPAATSGAATLHGQQQLQADGHKQPQTLFQEDALDPRLLAATEVYQRQERMSYEAVERGKKSQIMLENAEGSARTDTRSNDIISQRALKRWQKQKEMEAAKLRAKLDAQTRPTVTPAAILTPSGDYKNPISNNVSLAGQQAVHTVLVSRSAMLNGSVLSTVKAEIPDMELQAEGIAGSVLDGDGTDSFMTDLFIRDPETGFTYRQTQLLQDDPPNPELMEELEGVAPTHSMVLDAGLEGNFVEDSLNFHHLE